MTFNEYYRIDISKDAYDYVTVVIGSDKKDGISIEYEPYCKLSNKYRFNKLMRADGNFFILSRNQEFNTSHKCTVRDIAKVLHNGLNGEKIFYLYKGVRRIQQVSLQEMLSYSNEVYTINGNVIVTMEEE